MSAAPPPPPPRPPDPRQGAPRQGAPRQGAQRQGAPRQGALRPAAALPVQLICAIIGVGALVAVLLTATVTSDSGHAVGIGSAPATSATPSAPDTRTASDSAAPTSSNSAPSGGAAPASSSGSTTAPGQPSNKEIIAEFPFPPGSVVDPFHHLRNEKFRRVRSSLFAVRRFYEKHLSRLGGIWQPQPDGRGKIDGHVIFQSDPKFPCYLTISALAVSTDIGLVAIEVNFNG